MFRKSLIIFSLLAVSSVWAGNNILEIKNIGYEQIYYSGFVLNSDKKVAIKAVGAGGKKEIRRLNNSHIDRHNMFAYAWIINAQTRKMVWRMTIENTERVGWSEWNRLFDEKVRLPKGEYEVYFSAVEPSFFSMSGGLITLGKVFKKIFSNSNDWDYDADKWMIKISGVDEVLNQRETKKSINQKKESAILQLYASHDGQRRHRGFTLTRPLKVTVYAIGEGFKGEMFDYAWIINAQTRERVWTMREADTEYAGGATKNRVAKNTILLQPGDYLVFTKSDGTHSPEEWNSNPPYDPFHYGITITAAGKGFDPSIIKKYSETAAKPIVSITHVGDYAYKEAGFKLTKRTKIRIFALGEGRDGDMFDYGWITNAENGETVWKMRYKDTENAGGGSKNRLFDGVIELNAGEYILYFQSDDSHSYDGWNVEGPDKPEMWGISIFAVGSSDAVQAMDISKTKKETILARLIRVGDDEHVRKQFTLDKKTRIRIYCIGEGDWDEMYDYGWIRDADNDLVWKMRYRETEHAGGAKKNRIVDTIITLDPGIYTVHFRSDDSHSYYGWNDDAPYDKRNWGITIFDVSN